MSSLRYRQGVRFDHTEAHTPVHSAGLVHSGGDSDTDGSVHGSVLRSLHVSLHVDSPFHSPPSPDIEVGFLATAMATAVCGLCARA